MEFRFDLNKLTELMCDFYTLTNTRMVMFDNSFVKICSFPEEECDFCAEMKKNTHSRRLCQTCDEEACRRCKTENRLHIYECHAGITEAAFPLKFGGINLGYTMFGQIVDKIRKSCAGASCSCLRDGLFRTRPNCLTGSPRNEASR